MGRWAAKILEIEHAENIVIANSYFGTSNNFEVTFGSRLIDRNPLHIVATMKVTKLNQIVGIFSMLKIVTFFASSFRLELSLLSFLTAETKEVKTC